MTVFVPGPLRNPMNGSHGHWSKHARWARGWRERTAERLRVALLVERLALPAPRAPKVVQLVARTHNRWDDDALPAGLKPVRDALKDAGIIHDDAVASGHRFFYGQVLDRANRGVEISWELAV